MSGDGHSLRANGRRIVLLLLTASEAAVVDEALRQFRPSSGGGQRRLVANVREMIHSSRFSERELARFAELENER